jgi:predicted RNA binding protein YcfA (HicA-like mRNA interferase family)
VKVPRDLSGPELIKALKQLGYQQTRQASSHIRLTTELGGEHNVTVPDHDPISIGTLTHILSDIATHHGLSRQELLRRLFP